MGSQGYSFPKMMLSVIFLLYLYTSDVYANINILDVRDQQTKEANFIKDLVVNIPNRKGWTNILVFGDWHDSFFEKVKEINRPFVIANDECEGQEIDELLQYKAHILILKCQDLEDFEKKLDTIRELPYWHPHSNTIVYYEKSEESEEIIAKVFYGLWFHKITNAILLQYDAASENFMITHYNPYISKNFKLKHSYGCWTLKKIVYPIESFEKSFVCTEGCHNVTVRTKVRANHLGTCIGFETVLMRYDGNASHLGVSLFNDKTRNFHGFTFRTYGKELFPFLLIQVKEDGTYDLSERDGLIWATVSEIMNFTIDFAPSESILKGPFDFEESIQQIYEFSQRKGDLLMIPVYQFELVIVQIDITVPFKASGICFLSHRAGFETTLFDVTLLNTNITIVIQFICCFLGTWFVFFVFNTVEKGNVSCDQIGKDLVNAFRNMMSVSLYKPPKKRSFRLFLGISIWSFFIMNFATQAAIISFFSAHKRGKDVETYDDVVEKGYPIEGMASPDILLPDTEERFRKINSKLVAIQDTLICVNHMSNDSGRICLVDCAVGRYLERNKLNEKGDQYLHIAKKDQIHSHYLNWIFHKDSPLTDQFNRIMLLFLQAGLIDKWEQYRFTDLKDEPPFKRLGMNDLGGVFKCFLFLTALSVMCFVVEVAIGTAKYTRKFLKTKFLKWQRTRAVKTYLKLERQRGAIKIMDSSTQTM